jgi:predicted membrane-bound spermidine synthase
VAGIVVWLIGSLFPTLVWGFQLQLPLGLIAEGAVGGLVAVVAATLVGAWSYKE